jgi:hypothetical protein
MNRSKEMIYLNPCQCGGDPIIDYDLNARWAIFCYKCGMYARPDDGLSRIETIEAWNRGAK